MYPSAWYQIHYIHSLRFFRYFAAETEKLDKIDRIALIRGKRGTYAVHICCVTDTIWDRGISQCRASLEQVSAPTKPIISLGHCVYDVWLLQTTVSGGIGCKVKVGFESNKWIKPAANDIRYSTVDMRIFYTKTHLFINKASNSTLIPDSPPWSINLFCSLK